MDYFDPHPLDTIDYGTHATCLRCKLPPSVQTSFLNSPWPLVVCLSAGWVGDCDKTSSNFVISPLPSLRRNRSFVAMAKRLGNETGRKKSREAHSW